MLNQAMNKQKRISVP